jgi:hypothetical protein
VLLLLLSAAGSGELSGVFSAAGAAAAGTVRCLLLLAERLLNGSCTSRACKCVVCTVQVMKASDQALSGQSTNACLFCCLCMHLVVARVCGRDRRQALLAAQGVASKKSQYMFSPAECVCTPKMLTTTLQQEQIGKAAQQCTWRCAVGKTLRRPGTAWQRWRDTARDCCNRMVQQ